MRKIDNLLEKLSSAYAVSGFESTIFYLLKPLLEKFCDRVESDNFGNIIAFKKGKKKGSALIACHLDEIGFIVQDVEDGYIKFTTIGGSDPRILPGQNVTVLTEPPLPGIIGIKPPHFTTKGERKKVIPLEELFVDTGLSADELKSRVKIGDFIGFKSKYIKLNTNFRAGKSFDNRVGVVCGIEVLRTTEPLYDLYLILSCQEEFSGLGATITSYKIDPDFAIVIDVTHGPHPELPEYQTFQMNMGPVIGIGPTINTPLFKEVRKLADQLEIRYQIEPMPGRTGTDADCIAFVRAGIRTILVEVPIKYMHSPVEVVCLKDIENTVKLLRGFLKQKH